MLQHILNMNRNTKWSPSYDLPVAHLFFYYLNKKEYFNKNCIKSWGSIGSQFMFMPVDVNSGALVEKDMPLMAYPD